MNISGIRPSSGFYDYNTIKNSEVKNRQNQEIKAAEVLEDPVYKPEESENHLVAAGEDELRPDSGAAEYAKQYEPEAVYELKGTDSDLFNLDVEKAISDMKKDQVLQQYQFFIGESQAGEDLTLNRADENFTL